MRHDFAQDGTPGAFESNMVFSVESSSFYRWLRFGTVTFWFVTALTLQMASAHAAKVKLGWDANSEADLAGYRVYYGTSAGQYLNLVDVGNVTTAEIEDLVTGQQYWFVVTAYNGLGMESETSNEVTTTAMFELRRGTYIGLVGEDDGSIQASITIALGAKGKATGRIRIGSKQYRWKGIFGLDGRLVTSIARAGSAGIMTLILQFSGDGSEFDGTLTNGALSAGVNGSRATFGKGAEASQKGRYTGFFRESDAAETDGYGYAMLNVSKLGNVRTLAVLPDGSAMANGARLDNAGEMPVLAFLPKRKGTLFGRIHFRDVPDESDADGMLACSDPMNGISDLRFAAARYQRPTPGTTSPVIGTEMSLWSSGLPIVSGVLSPVSTNRFVGTAQFGEVFTVKVTPAGGRFTGSCQFIDAPVLLDGVLYGKGSIRGYGRTREAGTRVELRSVID